MKKIKGTKAELQDQFTSRFLMSETDMDSLRAMIRQYPNVDKWGMWNIYDGTTPLMSFDVKERTLYTSLNVTDLNKILSEALRLLNQEFRNNHYKLNAKNFYVLDFRNYIEMEDSSFSTREKIKSLGFEVIENDNMISSYKFDGGNFDKENICSVGVCQVMVNDILVDIYLRRFQHHYESANLDFEVAKTLSYENSIIVNDIFWDLTH